MSDRKYLGWHFAAVNGAGKPALRHGDKRKIVTGETLSVPDGTEIKLCLSGMHASASVTDALRHAPGPILCRVEVWGDVQIESGKFCGRHRRVLWMIDATETLRAFARRCALDVINLWDAREVVVRYLRTGRESIRAAAWAAAEAAAKDAAGDAAWAAANATAGAAAWAEAWAASRAKQRRCLTAMVCAEAQRQGVLR